MQMLLLTACTRPAPHNVCTPGSWTSGRPISYLAHPLCRNCIRCRCLSRAAPHSLSCRYAKDPDFGETNQLPPFLQLTFVAHTSQLGASLMLHAGLPELVRQGAGPQLMLVLRYVLSYALSYVLSYHAIRCTISANSLIMLRPSLALSWYAKETFHDAVSSAMPFNCLSLLYMCNFSATFSVPYLVHWPRHGDRQ